MPEWMQGIFDFGTDVAGIAGDTISNVASAEANAKTIQAQQAYMAQLAGSAQVIDGQQTSKFMLFGLGLLLFMLALRQTAQNR